MSKAALRALTAIAFTTVVIASAAAQQKPTADRQADAAEAAEMRRKRDAGLEKSAKEALSNLPDKKYDAWGNVRPSTADTTGDRRSTR